MIVVGKNRTIYCCNLHSQFTAWWWCWPTLEARWKQWLTNPIDLLLMYSILMPSTQWWPGDGDVPLLVGIVDSDIITCLAGDTSDGGDWPEPQAVTEYRLTFPILLMMMPRYLPPPPDPDEWVTVVVFPNCWWYWLFLVTWPDDGSDVNQYSPMMTLWYYSVNWWWAFYYLVIVNWNSMKIDDILVTTPFCC